jgi:hypothetical protein
VGDEEPVVLDQKQVTSWSDPARIGSRLMSAHTNAASRLVAAARRKLGMLTSRPILCSVVRTCWKCHAGPHPMSSHTPLDGKVSSSAWSIQELISCFRCHAWGSM